MKALLISILFMIVIGTNVSAQEAGTPELHKYGSLSRQLIVENNLRFKRAERERIIMKRQLETIRRNTPQTTIVVERPRRRTILIGRETPEYLCRAQNRYSRYYRER